MLTEKEYMTYVNRFHNKTGPFGNTGRKASYYTSPLPDLIANKCDIYAIKSLGGTLNRAGICQASSLNYSWPDSPLLMGNRSADINAAYNAAYQRFKSKVRGDTAAMGVSLASAKQSRDMIVDRSQKMVKHFSYWGNVATKQKVRRREFMEKSLDPEVWKRRGKNAANAHLETIFGWVPLIQDIRDACQVMTDDLPPFFVSGSKVVYFSHKHKTPPYYNAYDMVDAFGSVRVTCSAEVRIDNPNLWLANKLGVVNLPGVAWDLVPWSFLVNMFVNVNQVLSYYTDFMGLSLSNGSTTTTLKGRVDARHYNGRYMPYPWSSASSFGSYKRRTVGTFPRPSLAIKVPDMSLSTAAMAFSLGVQQFSRFSRLLR